METGHFKVLTPANLATYVEMKAGDVGGETFAVMVLKIAKGTMESGPRGMSRQGRGGELRQILSAAGLSAHASSLLAFEIDWTPKTAILAGELLNPFVIIDGRVREKLLKAASSSDAFRNELMRVFKDRAGEINSQQMKEDLIEKEKVSEKKLSSHGSILARARADKNAFLSGVTTEDIASILSLPPEDFSRLCYIDLEESEFLSLTESVGRTKLAQVFAGALMPAIKRSNSTLPTVAVAAAYLLKDAKFVLSVASAGHVDGALLHGFAVTLPDVADRAVSMSEALVALQQNWVRSRYEIALATGRGEKVTKIEKLRLFRQDEMEIVNEDFDDGYDYAIASAFKNLTAAELLTLVEAAEKLKKVFTKEAGVAVKEFSEVRYRDEEISDKELTERIKLLGIISEGGDVAACHSALRAKTENLVVLSLKNRK